MVGLLADDSVIQGSDEFSEIKEEMSRTFLSMQRKSMEEQPTRSNAIELSLRRNEAIKMTQTEKIESW